MAKNSIPYILALILAVAVVSELLFYSATGHLWPALYYPGDKIIEPVERPFYITQSGGLSLLIAECADKNYVANISDYIIEGTVDSVGSAGSIKEGIVTYTGITIGRYVKGTPPDVAQVSGNMLTLITPGGCMAGVCQITEDQPVFQEGKAVRLYFKEIDGKYSIVCGSSGVEELQEN